jgi:hypothetical protein
LKDQVRLELDTIIVKGIRAMPDIHKYPDWWISLPLDGYGSHLNVAKANQIFTNHHIWIGKEEADGSQMKQAYDQLQAKHDKAKM